MWAAIVIFCCILALLAYLDTIKPKNYPPGPKWLPILGSAMAVHSLRKKTGYLYKATAELAKQFGPVVGLKVGKDRTVVLCSYDSIKEMLSEDDFGGRPQGLFYETRTWGIRRGVLLTDMEFWQEQRRFVLRQLREFGFGKRNMSVLIEEECQQLVKSLNMKIAESGGESALIPMKDLFGVPVLNTLWTMMASIRYSTEDEELKTLQNLLTDLFANIDMVGTLFSQFPFLRFVAPEFSGYKMFLSTHTRLWKFLNDELDKHKKTYKADSPRDFMDVYLATLNSSDKKPSFSESQLLAICMDLFMAGSETTSKSLGFGFLYLVLNPDVQKKAQEEIDRVIGRDRLPQLDDRAKMPYMEGLVLESVRLFMGRTFSIPHRALKDSWLQGYFIPKDTMVIANFNGTLMDEKIWGDPHAFRPDRFVRDGEHVAIPDQYLPFGFGKHRCMGETLAKSNIFLFVTYLLQKFSFTVPPGHQMPSTDAIDGVTPSPKPFTAMITPRH